MGFRDLASARLYWEAFSAMSGPTPLDLMRMPTAISVFPKELVRISKRWAEARYANLVHFNEVERGGHFASLEQPTLFVEELRAGFREMRT